MANTSYYDLYKALKADGAVQGDWNSFHKFVGAQGKQGYLNRKKLYDALKADGAVQAKTYEEFNNTLFRGGQASLQAARQRNQQANTRTQAHARNNYGANNGAGGGNAATQQPRTAAQVALQRFAPSAPQQVQKPQRAQQPRGKISPFVRGLYEQQDLENGANDADYTSPNALKKKVGTRKLAEDAAMSAAANRTVNQDRWRREQPIVNTGSDEADQYIVKSQGQQEDEIAQSGKNFVDKNLGGYIDQAVSQEFQDAHKRGLQAEGNDYFQHGTGGADWYVGERKYQQQVDPNAIIKSLSAKLTSFTQNPEFIKQVEREAATLGVSPEDYVKSSVLPSLIEKASGRLMDEDMMRRMPKGTMEYITGGILNSMTGALLTGLTTSRQQRLNQQQADAMTEEGKNPNYQPGTLAKAARGTMAFVADAPAFGVAGKAGAKVAGRVLGAGVEQAAKIANMSKWQRMGYMAAQGGLSGGVTGFTYGATNAAVQNYSTGEDTSLGNTMKLALKGGLSEAASFAVMSGMGGAVGGAGYNIGINGTEQTLGGIAKNYFQKVGYEAVKTAMEGVGMWTGGNVARLVEGEKMDWSLASGLESAASAAMFKLLHAKDLAMGRKKQSNESVAEYMKNRVYSLFVSDAAKNGGYAFTTDEKNQLFGYGYQNGMADSRGDILRWAKQAKDNDPKTAASYYDGIMKDPNVSWDTKAKFSAMVMGIVPTARPMADHITFTTEKVGDQTQGFKKYVNEYAADGTLLSKHSFETKDERDAILYRQAVFNEEAKLDNAYALAIGKDGDNRLTQSMFLMSKGYDTSLPETEPKNQSLILGLRDKKSELYREFRLYCVENGIAGRAWNEVMDSLGITDDTMMKAWTKEPYKRTDKEQKAMTLLRKTLIGYIFDPNKPHPEQSGEDGKDVVADNNLGTEQPNGEAVITELRNLHQAEEEMEQMMRDNDVFSDNFKNLQQQGMTHPQIYDWMIQNGMAEEQLAPYAHYMNQVAKVQGMQRATAQAIEENVSAFVQDWSFHGTMDGKKVDGESALWVQDKDGRTLLVGSGDVAYNPTDGRPREGVGDMLVCLDPNTGETVYVKVEDTTLFQNTSAADLEAYRRQQLQSVNSVPYNQAAQEQASAEAAKPKPEKKAVDEAQPNGVHVEEAAMPSGSGNENQAATKGVATEKPAEQPTYPTDENGEPDFAKMTPEQGAQLYKESFNDPDAQVARDVKAAEKALKDAQKMQPSGKTFNEKRQSQQVINETIKAAEEQLNTVREIQKALTAEKVAATMGNAEGGTAEGANQAGSVAAEKFKNAPRMVGNKRTRTLPDGTKIHGHYEIVPAESLTPSHDAENGYKKSEGFPVDENGRTVNDRDYEHDKAAQQSTDQMALKYNGQAIDAVPTVSDEGIVYDGNGRTMAGQKAAKEGTDGEYINDLLENAENFGFTREQIEQSGIDHPRLVMVTDERLPYDTATFAKFNRNEKKTQSNTEQAVAKSKTLTADEVGAIVADIEGNGSLDAFFNNPKAINDLVKTLVSKGVIGQNEVAELMEGTDRLSAQGKEMVKNILLGSIFKPETIRMLGIDSAIKNKAIAGIRAVMDNLKLGDYSLRDEIDSAIQLLYEARQGGNRVDTLLRTPEMFDKSAAERYPSISQMMALALEGKVSDFRDLLNEYNKQAAARNTGELSVFDDVPTKDELIREFLNYKNWVDYETRGNSEREGGNDAEGVRETEPEAQERNDEWYNQSSTKLGTVKGEERKQILHQMGEYVKDYAKKNGFDKPVVYDTWDDFEKDYPGEKKNLLPEDGSKTMLGGFSDGEKMYFIMEDKGVADINDVKDTFNHEATHNDNQNDPSRKEAIIASVKDFKTVKLTDLMNAIEYISDTKRYTEIANDMLAEGKDPTEMLADEFLANAVEEIYRSGEDVVSEITSNPTLQKLALDAYKFRENDRRGKERPSESRDTANRKMEEPPLQDSKEASGSNAQAEESKQEPQREGGDGHGRENVEGVEPTDLEDRITETDDDWEEKGEHGTIYKRTYLLDDKKVVQVDEPNDKGEYTGSYYEYDGKRFGDLKEVADYIDGKAADEKIPLMPKTPEPTNVIEKAAEDYRKEHPLTEAEITNTDVFDDLPEDQKQYCIDAALDYLNGEDTSAIAEAYYRNIFEKRTTKSGENIPPSGKKDTTSEKKDTTSTTNPMEAIEKAAAEYNGKVKTENEAQSEKVKTREQLESEKEAADNEFDAFMRELKKKRGSQLNSGFIDQNLIEAAPKMFSLAAKCAYTRIKLGMYDAKEVVKDLRKRFNDAFDGFDKKDVDLFYSQIMNQKWRDGDKRMSLNDWAEHYRKLSPEHQKNLVGDSKDAEERKQKEQKFINKIQLAITLNKWKSGIAGLRKVAADCGLEGIKDTDIQELVETAVVTRARDIASSNAISEEVKFKRIMRLYENQPSLNQRDSERIAKQQYSTPAPYAYLADMYVKGNGKVINSALEPSAGNGMLTIGLPKDKVHVNDIDEARLMNLHRQGFREVTSQDGTQPFKDRDIDIVITNPPFGSSPAKDYDGYRISSLEGQMAINALESMKDDGRAAIIIGGKTEYAKNGSLNPKDKAFLGYLYSHYDVEDVINVDGSLYAKQGTSYPTRIILINGRRLDENSFPPVKDKARAETVKDYDELYKRISDDILRGSRMDSSIGDRTGEVKPEPDRQGTKDSDAKGLRPDGSRGSKPEPKVVSAGVSEESAVSRTNDELADERGADRAAEGDLFGGAAGTDGARTEPSQSEGRAAETDGGNGGQQSEPRRSGRNDAQPSTDGTSDTRSGGRLAVNQKKETKRELSSEKVTYTPKSGNPFTLQSVMPADQQEAVNKNLAKLGDADQFLVDELGYNDKDDLYKHLAAEQVDSVALAIHQAKQGNAFIIGDMTGIGKGRQAASLIRYAKKQGQIPVYFTKTAGLLSDVYRDLVDIGSPDLKPFVFGSSKEAAITDSEGNVKFALPTKSEVKRVLDYIEKNGKLPKEYDYVLTTYSQVGTGIYEYGEDGSRKEKKLAKGKSFGSAAFSGQRRRDAIEKLMDNGYLIMDESHTAGGDSGQGNYFQHIIQKAKNVTFFSATFAKRPDNMPIYALRTAMNQGELKASDLIDAVKRGGATLQEIMSQTLTQCGQMIRRERDMTGVTIDWKAIDDPEKVEEQRAQYNSIIGLFNDIINFQKTYVTAYVNERNDELAAVQASMGIKKGTAALGIKNTPFASKAFNTVQQVLLSLKAKSAAERAVEYLKQGMKPVIALNNTNESQTGNIALGEEMDAPDLGTSLKKGLEGTLRFTQKDAKDNSESGTIKLSDLGPDAEAAYHELEKKIEQTSTGLSLSPIDVIKNELEKAGYKVGELTGRQTEFVYNENGTVTKVKRTDTDKKKLAREFNDGQIDALILNKSAATGISLHASSKFKDQRKRVMIVAQQQLDVNDEVQMRGRIDRTGQILRGAYEYVVSLIPAEQRLLMMFKAKLKSLDANTTSSQKSKFNEMEVADITNKYGDKVVREYMAEHLDLYSRMADPFNWESTYGEDLSSVDPQSLVATRGGKVTGEAGSDASKLLGRMALLKVAEQEKMLQEIGDLYAAEINRLNEMGENDLEITELPLKAKTIDKEVWKKGTEPDGDNAFADNTYIEKVNMAILKKPMKAQEVQKAQEGLTGGRAWDEYRDEKKAEVKKYFDEKVAEATQKNEERAVKLATKAKEKYLKDAKRGQKDSGMSDEQIEKMAGYQYENIYNEEKAKLDAVVKNLQAKAEAFDRVLDTFNTEDAYVLPTDINNPNELSGFGNSYGRLIDIKLTDNFSPNASTVSFATLDGRRKITFPISGKVGSGDGRADVISAIDRMTRQASGLGDKHLRVLSMDTANWDKLVSNESRKDGYIITGNLMQALIDTKAQGVGGQLVKYTTEDGEVKTGILMPDRFKPNDVAVEQPISTVEEKFHKRLDQGGIESIKSSDGDVEIIQKFNVAKSDFDYQIRVPKSQKRGGKYFMDKELLSMMGGGNFETRGNSMLGEFKEKDLRSVLARLSNLGVKVREERAGSEEDATHFREERGVQYSKTDEKDVKNSRIIPEDVDKSVSSQIEKKFDDDIASVYGRDLTPEERNEVERVANLYRNTPIHDEYTIDEDGNKQNHGGLESAIELWDNLATNFEDYYGIERNANQASEARQGNGLDRVPGESLSGMENGTGEGTRLGGRAGEIPAEEIKRYQGIISHLASAERALAYHTERTRVLERLYDKRSDEWLPQDVVERIFKDFNSDKNLQTLFDRIKEQIKNLDIYFGEVYEGEKGTNGFYRHSFNDIRINFDELAAFGRNRQELASTILHEMLHPVTSDIIAMYQEGYTDKLTPEQVEAAKEAVDLFNEIKNTFKKKGWKEPYALTNAREFITELANPEWRAALKEIKNGDSWWKRAIKSVAKMLGFKTSTNKLDEAEKVLDNLLSNFGKEQFDYAAKHSNELFKDAQYRKVEDKDEQDRLNKEKTFRMYSGMQEVDGKLYSPMAAIIGGKRTDATEIGAWMRADERPDLVKNGKFTLVKTDKKQGLGEGDVDAAYNPYMHTSTSMMNDQFTGAYARGNIKVVEWEIPESEKTSGYRAEGAKDTVGLVPWHSGSVNGLLPKDRQRSVMLSRWRKAVRLVPDSEVAESIAQQLKGTGLAIPWNVVTPNQVRELAKLGVPITTVESGKQAPETKAKFEAQMEDLKKEFPQAKFVDLKMTKDAYKQWGKNGGTHFREDNAGVNSDAPVVAQHIDNIAKKVGGKVKMVSSVDEITDRAARRAIEEGRNITGWYDEKTGEVHLYMPNIHDRYTAEKTIWHEVVGHKGMRGLFGDKFDDFLRSVYYELDKPENAELKKLVDEERRYNPLNIYDSIEEGIARLAEDGKGEPGFWNAIKNKVTDLLHEVGYRIAPNTKDVKYLLWLAKNVQKNPNDLTWKMRADAVRYKLEKENVPAVKEHEGMFFGDDKIRSLDTMTKAEYNEATDGEIHFRTTPSAATALDRYHNELDKHGYMFTESYMDNMLSLKHLMQAIEPDVKNIADIKSSENPYILQNTMQGAMSNAAQMFERNVMKPLDKAMADVLDAFDGKKDEDKIKNFNLYMITKHGLERNRILYVRDAMRDMMMDEKQKKNVEQLEQDWWDELETLKEQLDKGQIDLKGYFGKVDDFIRYRVDDSYKADEHDYSGIHAIQDVEHDSDPYNDAEAIASVMDSEASMESVKSGSVKDFWDKVKAATQYSLDCDYKNGLMSRDLYGHVSRMFEWYVPLRKYDEQTAEDTYGYITEKGDPKNFIGRTIMRARGRKSLSETNVLAQIGAMGNRAINNGGQNAIKQAFARFIRSHANNNLVTETSVWYVEDPTTKTVTERYPEIPEDATPDEINTIVEDFNREMRDLQSKGLASKVRRRGTIGYRFQKAENRSQHLVDVMIAGKKHTFVINGNPRAAQALNGLLENSGAKGIMKPLGSISRMMAQLCTSYNPEFVMRNIMRDAEFASSNVTAKEGARYGGIWAKYYAQLGLYKGASTIGAKDFAGTTGLGLFAKYRNGTLDTSDKVQRYFKEFMENGGETGWVQIKNMKEWEKQYKQDVKAERSKVQKGGKMVRDFFFGNLENLNEVAENIARFATYCASRDYGRTVIRSVYDAKEVSTNFNRHGSGDAIKSFKNGEMGTGKAVERWAYGFTSSYLRHCSMFFNAGIQSTNLLVKNLKTNPVGTSVNMLSIPFALGALGALLNNALIASEDEKDRKGVKDPYGELPDYIRRNNLCIYKGGGEFITIPLAIELRAFYGLGDLAAGLTFSPNVSGQKNPFFDAVGSMSQLVPVMDYLGNSSAGKDPIGETIKAISPSAISPFVEWEMNSDWKGSPIERRGDYNKDAPAWQRAYNGTPGFLKDINKKVNAATNDVAEGNEDMLGNSFLDMVTNPSMLNHYFGGIGGGAATFSERLLGAIKHGKDTETKDIPFVRSLLYTPSEQTSLQRTKSKWYNYKNELETTMANVDRLKAKNVPIDKRLTNLADYYHFQNSSDAAKVRVIELAEKQMKQWKKMRDRASDTESVNFANQNIDRIMMEAVEELDRME